MCIFNKNENTVVIDADGCPVVKLAARIARENNAACLIVCNSAHVFYHEEIYGADLMVVSQGADSADLYIANHIRKGDIVITQDYGLAAMALAKGAVALNQDGKRYTDENITLLLTRRFENKKLLRSGKHPKGAPKRKAEQNVQFEKTLRSLLEDAEI